MLIGACGSRTGGGYGMAMIGVTTELRGKLISPRGPSGGRYSIGGSKAAGRWTNWGSLGSK